MFEEKNTGNLDMKNSNIFTRLTNHTNGFKKAELRCLKLLNTAIKHRYSKQEREKTASVVAILLTTWELVKNQLIAVVSLWIRELMGEKSSGYDGTEVDKLINYCNITATDSEQDIATKFGEFVNKAIKVDMPEHGKDATGWFKSNSNVVRETLDLTLFVNELGTDPNGTKHRQIMRHVFGFYIDAMFEGNKAFHLNVKEELIEKPGKCAKSNDDVSIALNEVCEELEKANPSEETLSNLRNYVEYVEDVSGINFDELTDRISKKIRAIKEQAMKPLKQDRRSWQRRCKNAPQNNYRCASEEGSYL